MTYFIIFIFKLLENTLATLRIILIANNKKLIGAVLTFVISIIWILSVSYIVFDFKDYLKIFSFAIGSAIGSYLGNVLEEKLALGCIIIRFNINYKYLDQINIKFKNHNKTIIKTSSFYKIEIECTRKNQNKVIRKIKDIKKDIKITIIKVFNC